MQILLIAATEMEIRREGLPTGGVDLLITGVGVPATIYHLQKRLHQLDYDLVIQAGIAGSFDESIQPGEVVLVNKDRFADLGTEEKGQFRSVFEYGLANSNEFPFEDGWLLNKNPAIPDFPLLKASGVTINTISDSQVQKQRLLDQYDPGIESMEGAALHYVCLQEQLPFIQLRSISNPVGERDRSKWKMTEAVSNLNRELERLILHFKSTT
ncbi:MAG: futalosine hydrolase [Chitinophagaceae bacterium]|nr:futalosine hydrolase [Chitinophagaceae bacterium]MBL0056184.1 futalosine hydrolase [Chitinophagaceae bacterium]